MKRIGLSLAALCAAVAALGAVVTWAMPEALIRQAVVSRIEGLTGRTPTIAGHARLSLLPYPTVRLEGVTLPGFADGPPLVRADAIEGAVSIPALLFGSVDLQRVTLERPRFTLIDRADGQSWNFASGALAEIAAGKAPPLPLRTIHLVDGSLFYTDRLGRSASFAISTGSLAWAGADSDLAVEGELVWRNQPLHVGFDITTPGALLGGGKSEIAGRIASDPLTVSVSGTVSGDGRIDGDLAVTSPSLRSMLRWIGLPVGNGPGGDAFSLRSPASITSKGMALPGAEMQIDGNDADGAFAVRFGGERPKISGTLALDTLDVSPYARPFELTDGAARAWRHDPLDLALLSLVDLDLRVSSSETTLDKARLGRLAASIVAHNGAMELSLGDVAAYGGSLKGRFSLARKQEGADVGINLSFDQIDSAKALADLFGFHHIEGLGHGSLNVTASGRSIQEMLTSLSGDARLALENGALVGIDLVDVMRRIERRPLSANLSVRSGRTPFTGMSCSLAIAKGRARTTDARLDDSALLVTLAGEANVVERDLALDGRATLASAAGQDPFVLPFRVSGGWENPTVEPDTETLIRRSGAAAPLLRYDNGKIEPQAPTPVRADGAASP